MPRMKRKGHEDVCFDANINVNRNTISCYHLHMKYHGPANQDNRMHEFQEKQLKKKQSNS